MSEAPASAAAREPARPGRRLVFITAQNLASSNLIRPSLERLAPEIEAVILFDNLPLQGLDSVRRLGRMLRGTSPSFVAFKLLECNVHEVQARLRGETVAEIAARCGVEVRRSTSATDEDLLIWLESLAPDYIVNTGPVFLPRRLRRAAKIATLNCHSARLPDYRGPANYIWTRLEGEEQATFTVQRMVAKMDAGPIWAELDVPITPEWSAYRLNHELTRRGGEFLADSLQTWLTNGPPEERTQDESRAQVRSFPAPRDVARLRARGVRLVRLRDLFDCL